MATIAGNTNFHELKHSANIKSGIFFFFASVQILYGSATHIIFQKELSFSFISEQLILEMAGLMTDMKKA
jgi:hypothetical protein